jgi:hypothetical protein
MTDEQRFLFDLLGYLVLEDVLSSGQVAALNALLDEYDLWSGSSPADGGWLAFEDDDFLTAGRIHRWGEPFRRLIANPTILPYLGDLIGPQFRFEDGKVLLMREGSNSGVLHGGRLPFWHHAHYEVLDGQIHNGLFVVSFALCDHRPGEGGFVCLPGSHKINFPLPDHFHDIDESLSYLQHVPLKAGSVLLFTEALAHGTWRWTGEHERRVVLLTYAPGNASYGRDYASADDVPDADWTAVERLLLEPPYVARGREFRPHVIPDDG